jgi:cytochrome c556
MLRPIGLMAVLVTLMATPLIGPRAQGSGFEEKRETAMKAMGKEMGAIKALVGGPAENLGQVKQHAATISNIAKDIPGLFPPGSDNEPDSEALPVVWTDQAGFQQAAARLGDLADQLAASADTGDAKQVGAAFAAVGKNGCSGCHQTYREPQS